jgi:anti-sigma-K factor RskA
MDIQKYISSGIIEMYVTGMCSIDEKTELEDLRAHSPELNDAVLKFEAAFENNLLKHPTMPSAETDKKIAALFQKAEIPVVKLSPSREIRKINRLKFAAAAAVMLLSLSLFYNYNFYQKSKQQQLVFDNEKKSATLPEGDYNILKQPSITPVAMYGVSPHTICRCTMFWDKKTGKAYIMIHHLMPAAPQNNYQLWAMVDGKPVSVGLVNEKIRDRFIEMQNLPQNATAFIVTLEKNGGSNTPTLDETYLSGRI